jgi:hypothetical protein
MTVKHQNPHFPFSDETVAQMDGRVAAEKQPGFVFFQMVSNWNIGWKPAKMARTSQRTSKRCLGRTFDPAAMNNRRSVVQ